MKKMYIVRYYGGSYEDWYEVNLFVTDKKTTATRYVTKFNRLLEKWKEHYKQYEGDVCGMRWIKHEYVEKYFSRWDSLKKVTKCYWAEIDVR